MTREKGSSARKTLVSLRVDKPITRTSIEHLALQLQKCKPMTEAGESIKFQINEGRLQVWTEARDIDAKMAELRAGIERERAAVEGLKALTLEAEGMVNKLRATSSELLARLLPTPPGQEN